MQRLYLYREQSVEVEEAAEPGGRSLSINPLVFLAAHVPLAYLMSQVSVVSTVHAAATFIFGLWFAITGRRVEQVVYVCAYIMGAEVLWRMTGAEVFWEFGKYATAALFIVSMARRNRLQGAMLPFLYFVLLLPSVALTIMGNDWDKAREHISFNLSGPFALMVGAVFFSQLQISREELQRLYLMVVGPIIGIATIVLIGTLTNPDLVFTRQSNAATSGGFGPNQVSSALGMGALLILLYVLNDRTSKLIMKALLSALIVWLVMQSALTYSRGGLYNAAGAAVLAFCYLIREPRTRIKFIVMAVLVVAFTSYIVWPRLDEFTDGGLSTRFESTDPTNRDHIIEADLQIWSENPIFGVGPGEGTSYRRSILYNVVAHTEFTRLFAEHGSFGFIALLLLIISGVQCLLRTSSAKAKAVKASLLGWSALYMTNAAMRLVAPSFLFGLAFADLEFEEQVEPEN